MKVIGSEMKNQLIVSYLENAGMVLGNSALPDCLE